MQQDLGCRRIGIAEAWGQASFKGGGNVTVARSALAARSWWSVRRDAPEPLRLLTCSRPCVYKLARPIWLLFFFFFLLWLCMVVKEALATRFPSTASCTRDIIQSPSPLQSGKRI